VFTEGDQTINGIKTFTDLTVFSGGISFPFSTAGSITLTDTNNQLVLGTGNTITLSASTPLASRTYVIPEVLADANFIMSQGAQTLNGSKTFSSAIRCTAALGNQLILGSGNTATISALAPAAPRIYTINDPGTATANFVMSEGIQTINSVKTFTSAIKNTALTNQLVLGLTQTVTISGVAPAASRVYSIQDAGADRLAEPAFLFAIAPAIKRRILPAMLAYSSG
jgi:hypothetical protein